MCKSAIVNPGKLELETGGYRTAAESYLPYPVSSPPATYGRSESNLKSLVILVRLHLCCSRRQHTPLTITVPPFSPVLFYEYQHYASPYTETMADRRSEKDVSGTNTNKNVYVLLSLSSQLIKLTKLDLRNLRRWHRPRSIRSKLVPASNHVPIATIVHTRQRCKEVVVMVAKGDLD